MAIPLIPAIYGASAVTSVLLAVYNSWRERPDLKMAEHLRALEYEKVRTKTQQLDREERTRAEFAQARQGGLEDLVEAKQGMDEGWISPAELGIKGGGVSVKDRPMVNLMAARLGMDPQDLMARFDPSRSSMYMPASRRGEYPRPSPKQLAVNTADAAIGPMQLNPNQGFGM